MADQTKTFSPVNGGVNSQTGNLVLLFADADGHQARIEIPYDQSLATFEMIKRAANSASSHPNNKLPSSSDQWDSNLRAYEAKEILFGKDVCSDKRVLTLRTVDDLQMSLVVDTRIIEQIGLGRTMQPAIGDLKGTYASVAEDIDHFQRAWCTIYVPPSDVELRWGVAALRRLLINGLLGRAWRAMGFEGEPIIPSPDVERMLNQKDLRLEQVAHLIAGGGSVDGIEVCGLGMAKVFNPQTGKGPDEEEGFAVSVFNFSRDARGQLTAGEYDHLVRRPTKLSAFLRSWSAIRRGQAMSRHDVIQYFAKWAGGVHSDAERGADGLAPHPFELIEELKGKVHALSMDGLDFELLSIGQLLGRSPDLDRLKQMIIERDSA